MALTSRPGRTPTEDEQVAQEIARTLPQFAKQIAAYRQRPLGYDSVGLQEARAKWNQGNSSPDAQAEAARQGLWGWELTKVLYPYRDEMLQAAKRRGGVQGMIAFEKAMRGGGTDDRGPETDDGRPPATGGSEPAPSVPGYASPLEQEVSRVRRPAP